MKRALIALLLILCVLAALLWLERPRLNVLLRTQLEQQISQALGAPARVRELGIEVFPLRLIMRGIALGAEPLVTIDQMIVDVDAGASLVETRPVLSLWVGTVTGDLLPLRGRAPQEKKVQTEPLTLPSVRVERLAVGPLQLRFPMDHTHGDLQVARLSGTLQTARLGFGLTGSLVVDQVELTRAGYRAVIQEARATGGMDAAGLFVDEASVQGEGITATLSATATAHRQIAAARFDPSLLGVIVDELGAIGGAAQVDGILEGDLANPAFDGRLTLERGAIADRTLGTLTAHVGRVGTDLRFDDIYLQGPTTGQVRGRVDLDIYKEVPIESDLQWTTVDLEQSLAILGLEIPFDTRVSAETTIRGTLDPLDLAVTGTGTLQIGRGMAAREAAAWQATARVHPHDLQTHLELSQPTNQLVGDFLLTGHDLGGTITLTAADLSALSPLLPEPVTALALTGRAEGVAAFSGTTDDPVLSGQASLRAVTVLNTRVPEAQGDFAIAAGALTTHGVTIDTPTGRAELTGVVALGEDVRNDWALSLHAVSTDLVLGMVQGFTGLETPLNGGTLDGRVQCREPWPQVDVQSSVTARWLRIGTEPLERVDAEVSAKLPDWTLRLRATRTAEETLTVEGSGQGQARLDLALESTPIRLERWSREMGGTLEIDGRLSGDPARLNGVIDVQASQLSLQERPIGDAAARLTAKSGVWQLEGQAMDHALTLAGNVQPVPLLPYALTAQWSGAQFAPLLSKSATLSVMSTGALTLRGTLKDLARPNGELRAERLDIRDAQYELSATEPIRIEMAAGRVTVQSLKMAGMNSHLTVAGDWSLDAGMRLALEGGGDLQILELLDARVESVRGTFSLSADVRRAAGADWILSGRASVHDMTLDLGIPVAFSDTNGTVDLNGSRIVVETFGGEVGGGHFSISGFVDLNSGPHLDWQIKEVGVTAPEWLEQRLSGTGRVEGSWQAPSVSGDLEVLNALYDRDIQVTDLLPWLRQQITPAPRREPPPVVAQLNLRIHAPGGLYVDNNFVKAELAANLRIAGTTERPTVLGTMEILSGEVSFRNRVFTVTGGAIDFRDPFRINPLLNIEAETRISTTEGEYIIVATVTGSADAPRVQLSSDDPGVTQNDMLSLIAAGQTSAQLKRESTGISAGSILSLLPTGSVESRVKSVIGVDRFEIGSERMQDTSIVPRVTIGKDLTDRLRATVSSTLVETYQTVTLEYLLTRRISLLATWQGQTSSQAGAVGGGGKLRYEFRGSPFSLLHGVLGSSTDGDAE